MFLAIIGSRALAEDLKFKYLIEFLIYPGKSESLVFKEGKGFMLNWKRCGEKCLMLDYKLEKT